MTNPVSEHKLLIGCTGLPIEDDELCENVCPAARFGKYLENLGYSVKNIIYSGRITDKGECLRLSVLSEDTNKDREYNEIVVYDIQKDSPETLTRVIQLYTPRCAEMTVLGFGPLANEIKGAFAKVSDILSKVSEITRTYAEELEKTGIENIISKLKD